MIIQSIIENYFLLVLSYITCVKKLGPLSKPRVFNNELYQL